MPKKILSAIGFFILIFLPVFAISIYAFTVFHQIILFIGILVAVWSAFYLGNVKEERDRLNREVLLQAYELKKSKEALSSCLAMDTQTHVYNERLLDSRLTEECDRARRYHRPLSMLLVALDSFSELTQFHSSVFSEVIVQEVTQFLKESTRSVDIIIRRGDSYFVTILPETQANQARIVAERIRYAVEKNTFRIEGKEVKVTVSIGFVAFDPTVHRGKEDVLAGLEKALVQARKFGANRIATVASEME